MDQERAHDVFVFFIVFGVLSAPVYLIAASGYEFTLLREGFAAGAAALLRLLGHTAAADGVMLYGERIAVNVTRDSTAWKSMFAFAALVFASRRSLQWTVYGLFAGFGVLVAANVVRIASMVYLTEVHAVPFEVMHTVLWRWGLTVVVVVAWAVWLRCYAGSDR